MPRSHSSSHAKPHSGSPETGGHHEGSSAGSGGGSRSSSVSYSNLDKYGSHLSDTSTQLSGAADRMRGLNFGSQSFGAVGQAFAGRAGTMVSEAANDTHSVAGSVSQAAGSVHKMTSNYRNNDESVAKSFHDIRNGGDPVHTPHAPASHSGSGSKGGPKHSGGTPKSPGKTSPSSTNPNRPHNPQDTSVPGKNKNCVTDPVDVASGDVVLIEQDLELPAPLPFALERTHLSSYRAGRWFGPSWSATVDQRLELDEQGVCYLAADGLVLVYPHPAPGAPPVLPAAGPEWPLAIDPDGGYTVTLADRTLRFGTRSGARREIVELDAITDPAGNRVDIDRDEQHLPVLLRHSTGYRVALRAADNRITELRVLGDPDVDVLVLRYGYDEHGRLHEVVNSSGRPTRYSYDQAGRLTGWQDRNGTWYRYEYDADGRCVRTTGMGDFFNSTLHYDRDRRITTFTNSLGQVTVYQLNELHQTVRETDPLGNITTFEWDRRNRLSARTDPLGRVTRFEYGADGEVSAVERADGSRVRIDLQRPFSISVHADGRRWRRRYAERPDPLTTPLGVSETTTDLASLDGGNAGAERRNGAGGGPVERDVFGRPVAAVDAAGRQARLSWTIEGKLAWRTRPSAREQWRYDPEGNEIDHTDAVGQVTRTEYGPFDLRTATIDATGARTRYVYDTELRLVEVVNPHGQSWHYRYDAAGRLVESVDFDGRRQRYDYDAAGQQIRSVNAAGQAVEYSYDAIGNLVEQRTETGRITYRYDPVGNLIAAGCPDGELTIERDELGQVRTHTVNGSTTTFDYDEDGFWVRRRTPSGVDSAWAYGERGEPESVTIAGHTIAFGYDENGRELGHRVDNTLTLRRTIDENGLSSTETVTVDAPGEAAGSWPVSMRRYRFRADDHLVGVEDGADSTIALDLDQAGRITVLTAGNRTERYGYDALGNLTASAAGPHEYQGNTLISVGDTSFQHDAQGRLVRRTSGAGSWHYTWDALDRLTGVLLPDGTRWQYRYDPLGRRIAKQHLDGAGRRLEQVGFVWDGALLVEQIHTDATGTQVTTWVHHPVGDRPLAQLHTIAPHQKSPGIQRFHTIRTDPLGTPVELLDGNGASAWRSATTIWGAPLPGHTGPADTPLRFPGQYHDPETGLHYNVYRYYDPVTARYLSPDPLGLAPAPNPVAYVPNPLRLADPLGLTPGTCTAPNSTTPSGANPSTAASSSTAPANPGNNATPGLVNNTRAPQYMSNNHFNNNHQLNDPDLMVAANNYLTTSAHPGATHKQKNDAAEAMGEVGAVSYLKAHTGNQNIGLHYAGPNAPHNLQTTPGQPWPHAVAFHSSGVADVTHWDGHKLHVIEAKGGTSTLGRRDQEYFHQTTSGQQVAQDLHAAGAAPGNINMITKNSDGSWKTFQPGDRRGYINQYTTNSLPQGGDAYLTDIGHKMANSPATTTDGRQLLGQQILQHGSNGSLHYVPVYTQAAHGQGVDVMVGQKP